MNNIPLRQRSLLVLVCIGVLSLGGCSKSAPTESAPAKGVEAKSADAKPEGVTLTPEQIEKLGLTTKPAKVGHYSAEAGGYGTVLAHDAVAQAAAELATAEATERQSSAALARTRRLSGTSGALSADIEETSVRQAAVDTAATTLAKQRLSTLLGQNPPWKDGSEGPTLQALANGTIKLVRASFPLGALNGAAPKTLRATRIDATVAEPGWTLEPVWSAPADSSVPGRSFFSLLRSSEVGEGERLLVYAPVGAVESGVWIPAAALLISEGKYWCYIEKSPGKFVKSEIAADKPLDDGYFLSDGVKVGEKVVTTGAGNLLAQESGSDSDAE